MGQTLPSPDRSHFVVEVFFEDEAQLWWYEVDELNIIGTGCLTHEDAEKYALEAIEFALEDPPLASG